MKERYAMTLKNTWTCPSEGRLCIQRVNVPNSDKRAPLFLADAKSLVTADSGLSASCKMRKDKAGFQETTKCM